MRGTEVEPVVRVQIREPLIDVFKEVIHQAFFSCAENIGIVYLVEVGDNVAPSDVDGKIVEKVLSFNFVLKVFAGWAKLLLPKVITGLVFDEYSEVINGKNPIVLCPFPLFDNFNFFSDFNSFL